jgi:hypothetical protein
MFVEAELGEDSVEARGGGFGHRGIVKQGERVELRGIPGFARGRLFDSVTAPLRCAQDDSADKDLLFVAQRLDRIQAGGLDCRQHAADYSYKAENHRRPDQGCGVNIEVDVAFAGVFDESAP